MTRTCALFAVSELCVLQWNIASALCLRSVEVCHGFPVSEMERNGQYNEDTPT